MVNMKRLIALLLAAALALSLVACGNNANNTTDTISEDDFIGTWEREFTNSDNEKIKQTIEIYEGGTGHFTITHYDGEADNNYDGTWELNDDVLNFSYTLVTIGLKIDKSSNPVSLIRVDDSSAIFNKIG